MSGLRWSRKVAKPQLRWEPAAALGGRPRPAPERACGFSATKDEISMSRFRLWGGPVAGVNADCRS
jgi:hypothetical protein